MIDFISITCPLCQSGNRKILGKPVIGQLFNSLNLPGLSDTSIARCQNCSFVFADPFPLYSSELLQKMYSRGYFHEFTKKWERICHRDNPLRRFTLAQSLQTHPIRNFLELGCGQGYAMQTAQSLKWNVYGQDISMDFAEIVKKRLGIEIKIGELTSETFEHNYFDLIYIDSVLEHVTDPVRFLRTVLKFLAPEGLIYLVLPNEDSWPNLIKDLIHKVFLSRRTSRLSPFVEPYHRFGFSKKSIALFASMFSLQMPYCICSKSFMHISRHAMERNLFKRFARKCLGIIHLLSDLTNNGVNMEVVLKKHEPSR